MASETRRRAARWAGALLVTLGLAAIPFTAFAQQSATVAVELSEFAVAPAVAGVQPGTVTFETTNAGRFPHEFVVVRTDLAADALPAVDGEADENQIDIVAATDTFDGGESRTLTVDLAAGNYLLICNVKGAQGPGHYGRGMTTAFTVSNQISPPDAGNAAIASTGGTSATLAALLLAATAVVLLGGRALTTAAERRR
jgi:uncharacterized cupredoxin-like copper-binding protein